ncbi:MAG: TonB-dependent receptor [Bacteroidales bacterium]|jgi:iron complex outermembrane receptor protein|nr:TonB-dependent receptor [Bacteroidales bacterium]
MKRTFIFCLLILFIGNVFSQVITGKVVDEKGEPLTGASVVLKEYLTGATTGISGEFSINTRLGKSTVIISFIGHESWEKELNITEGVNNLGSIALKPRAYISEEIIVKATRADDFSPVAHSTITSGELQKRNVTQDIPYLLELTPSLVATSEAGTGIGATSFRIRGTDPSRINITVNGIPLNDAESQVVFWNNMPGFACSVSSMQITRGVGTSTNGSAAFGASLNMFTTSLSNNPYAEVSLMGGSFGTHKEDINVGTGILKNGFSFDLRFSNLKSDGYVENGYSDHKSLMISGAWRNNKNIVRTNIIYGKQKTGITWEGCPKDSVDTNPVYNPAGEYYDENGVRRIYRDQSDNYTQTHYQLFYSRIINHKLDLNVSLYYTRGNGYYEEFKSNRKLVNYGLPAVISPNGSDTISVMNLIQQKLMDNDYYGGTFSLNYNTSKINLSGGGAISQYDGDHFGEIIWMQYAGENFKNLEWYRNNGLKTDMNIFAKINYEVFKNFHLYGDLQYRHIEYKMKGDDSDLIILDQQHKFDFFNPKAGIFYSINNKMKTYVSFATAHREPTRTNFKDAKGDPDKTPLAETLFDYELGYIYQSPRFSASVNFYYMDYIDQLVPTGEKSSVGYDIMTNVPHSYRAGVEIMAGVKPFKRLSIDANLTLSRNKIKNFTSWETFYDDNWNFVEYTPNELGETDLAYSPNIISSGIISYEIFNGFNISLISKYVGAQYFDNTSNENRKLDAYWVNNLQLDYSFSTKIIKEIQLKFQINNLFNVKYSNNAYGWYYYVGSTEVTESFYFPQAGINYMGGIVFKF